MPSTRGASRLIASIGAYGVPQIKDPQEPSCYFSDLPLEAEEGEDVASTQKQSDLPVELDGSDACSDAQAETHAPELAGQETRG